MRRTLSWFGLPQDALGQYQDLAEQLVGAVLMPKA